MFVTSRIVNHEASSSSWSCPARAVAAGGYSRVLYHAALAFTLDIKYSPGRKARGRGRGRGRPAAPAEFRLRRGGQRGRRGGRGGARGPEPAPGGVPSPVHFIALPRPACLRISSSFRIRLTSPSFMLYLPSLKRTPLLLLPVLWLVLCALLMALRNPFFPAQHTASENAHGSAFYTASEKVKMYLEALYLRLYKG